jgi:hypothetical protein
VYLRWMPLLLSFEAAPPSKTRLAMGRFSDELCKNRNGRFFLPYQEGWRPGHWNSYVARCGGEPALDNKDKQTLAVGFEIGTRCQRVWEDIQQQEAVAPLPAMCSALIAQINVQLVKERIDSPLERLGDANKFSDDVIDTEQLTDIISDYIFSRIKAGVKLTTTLDIPSAINNPSTHAHAVGLQVLLRSIAFFKFVFDQVLFLDSDVSFEGELVRCRITQDGLSETYFLRSKISQIAEGLIVRSMERKRPPALPREWVDYKIVSGVRFEHGDFTADFAYVPLSAEKSALIPMRESIECEYIFQTLDTLDDGSDVYRAWDVLYSLSKAMFENAVRMRDANLFSSTINRTHLLRILGSALAVSPTRARRLLDFYCFEAASRDGIWSRPIVKVDRTFVSLAHIAILETNRLRLLHNIVANAGLSALRGRNFEQKCVQQLQAPPIQNVVNVIKLSNPVYRYLGIKKLETDFILRMGNILLICEAKSTSHIATPREFFHGLKAIGIGTDQLRRRLELLTLPGHFESAPLIATC